MTSGSHKWNIEIRGGHEAFVVADGQGDPLEGTVQLDLLHRQIVEILEDRALTKARDGQIATKELKILGELLFKAIFHTQLLRVFPQDHRQGEGQRLLLRMHFEKEAKELQDLPWECMYNPSRGGSFIAEKSTLVLSRSVPGRPADSKPEPKLRVLIVVAQPPALIADIAGMESPEEARAEVQRIEDSIKEGAEGSNIEVCEEEFYNLDFKDFRKRLMALEPHVVHYIGHGRLSENVVSVALLSPEDPGQVTWMPAPVFAKDLANKKRVSMRAPRLVFLHLCQGQPGHEVKLTGAAPILLAQGDVQAVVAMQYPLPTDHACEFARAFYGQLGMGASLETAVQEARMALFFMEPDATQFPRFAAPVLFQKGKEELHLCKARDSVQDLDGDEAREASVEHQRHARGGRSAGTGETGPAERGGVEGPDRTSAGDMTGPGIAVPADRVETSGDDDTPRNWDGDRRRLSGRKDQDGSRSSEGQEGK